MECKESTITRERESEKERGIDRRARLCLCARQEKKSQEGRKNISIELEEKREGGGTGTERDRSEAAFHDARQRRGERQGGTPTRDERVTRLRCARGTLLKNKKPHHFRQLS